PDMIMRLSWVEAHREAHFRHVLLGLADAELAEMEDRGSERRRGMAVADACDEVIQRAYAARRDYRHLHGIGHRTRERDVVALFGAVAIHRGEQNFAGAKARHFPGIGNRVDARRVAAAMGENFPARGLAFFRNFLCVDRDDDALIAELLRRLAD